MEDNRIKINWWKGLSLAQKTELMKEHKPTWTIPMVDRSTSTIVKIFKETEKER